MHSTLVSLLDRLDSPALLNADVIGWGCPVLAFGDLSKSRVATLGLNPSNREFVDQSGRELTGNLRRFHTLQSLGLSSWSEADASHLQQILDNYTDYFATNPYDAWFKRLDRVVVGTGASYYRTESCACHLDLIPFATETKWSGLTTNQRQALSSVAAETLGLLLRDSPVRVLILNGMSVIRHFVRMAETELLMKEMPSWALPRGASRSVAGYGYYGFVGAIANTVLRQEILVLGFNHNLQSSFGVTSGVIDAIRDWVSIVVSEASV
jgi:hypothetical protein